MNETSSVMRSKYGQADDPPRVEREDKKLTWVALKIRKGAGAYLAEHGHVITWSRHWSGHATLRASGTRDPSSNNLTNPVTEIRKQAG
jgi:hypothetical protein